MRPIRLAFAAAVALLLAATLAACDDDNGGGPPVSTSTAVVREVLSEARPLGATGQDLALSRVTIQPGAEIAPHTHPGTQLAYIASGQLTYTVFHGEAQVTRSDGRKEKVTAGNTAVLNPGDSLVEVRGMAHAAKNAGTVPVVILLSSLFTAGEPASRPADVR